MDSRRRWTDVGEQAGDYFSSKWMGRGLAVSDFDRDGDLDVYVANDSDPNYLFRNEGDGTFQEVATWTGCGLDENGAAQASMGVAVGDATGNGEIDIFRKTGLNPVFFGETLTGDKMPNLTYMLVFNNMDERQANWRRFGSSPEWKALRAIPEYADKKILCEKKKIASGMTRAGPGRRNRGRPPPWPARR